MDKQNNLKVEFSHFLFLFNFRRKSGKKSGGQLGHKGSTLKMSKEPEEIQKRIPRYCKQCGEEFNSESIFKLRKETRNSYPPHYPQNHRASIVQLHMQ